MRLVRLSLWLAAAAVALRRAAAADAVYLQARGFPPVRCGLSPTMGGAATSQKGDFWMRGAVSKLLYRCRLDSDARTREQALAKSRSGRLMFLPNWSVSLDRVDSQKKPDIVPSRTPSFICATDGRGSPSPLPSALFPLRARRQTAGGLSQWQKCVLVAAPPAHGSSSLPAPSLVTVAFRGDAPTIVCIIGDTAKLAGLRPVELRGLLGPPYTCFLATYLDFPALSAPPAGLVFQRQVLNRWTTRQSDSTAAFLPPQCWPAGEHPDRSYHFQVAFDGNHAQRCRFRGDCPLCSQYATLAEPSASSFSSTDAPISQDHTTVSVLQDTRIVLPISYKPKEAVSKPTLFESRLCTYHSLDENNSTIIHQIPCFG